MSWSTLQFEWHVAYTDDGKFAKVLVRLVGTEYIKEFGPMPSSIVSNFIRAKRDALHRRLTTMAGAMKIFGDPKARL